MFQIAEELRELETREKDVEEETRLAKEQLQMVLIYLGNGHLSENIKKANQMMLIYLGNGHFERK